MALTKVQIFALLLLMGAASASAVCSSCGDEAGDVAELDSQIPRKLLQTCGANASPVGGVCKCNRNNIPVPGTSPLACCRPNAILVGGVCQCKSGTTFRNGNCVPNACVNIPTSIITCLVDASTCVTSAYCSCPEARNAGSSLARNCVRPLNPGGVNGDFCCGF